MGIYEDVTRDVSAAFDTDLADAVNKIRHRAIEIIDYDPSQGSPDRFIVEETSRGVFTSYSKDEVDNEKILDTDVRLLVLAAEFPTVPKVDDEIQELNENDEVIKTYKVVGFTEDPARATYEMQIRTSSDKG